MIPIFFLGGGVEGDFGAKIPPAFRPDLQADLAEAAM